MEPCLIGPWFLSPCFLLCTDQASGSSLWWAQFRLPCSSFELLSGLSTSCVFNDPLWSAGRMLRSWFCYCSCSKMGFCLLRSRSIGQMCAEVMQVLRNSQAFKDAFKAAFKAPPFHCWDTDVLLVWILPSPYSSFCAPRSVISREANVSTVLVKVVFLKGGGLYFLLSASIPSPLHILFTLIRRKEADWILNGKWAPKFPWYNLALGGTSDKKGNLCWRGPWAGQGNVGKNHVFLKTTEFPLCHVFPFNASVSQRETAPHVRDCKSLNESDVPFPLDEVWQAPGLVMHLIVSLIN